MKGLEPDDALDWFQALMALPPVPAVTLPDREALTTLFAQVDCHPLSIGVLAELLRTRRIAEVGERLQAILKTETDPLIASLNLSIERLAPEQCTQLPKLGVFQGGALETAVTMVTQLSAEQWAALRVGLEQTGLIRAETLSNWDLTQPYLRFHPTLAPALWVRLSADDRTALTARHRDCYYDLCRLLRDHDSKAAGAMREVVRVELSNLMAAVNAAIDAEAPEAADFVVNVAHFLGYFGLARDRAALVERAQAAAGDKGSDAWFRAHSQKGEQLFDAGRLAEAEKVFGEVLAALGEAPSYYRCVMLEQLAQCHQSQGRPDQAETLVRQALAEIEMLEQTPQVRHLSGVLHAALGGSLHDRGDLAAARAAFEAALAIAREWGDDRGTATVLIQLGHIAPLDEASGRYQEALTTFQALGEPTSVAVCWHQLGKVYQKQRRWEQAEHAFREAARLFEQHGDPRVAGSWHQLAQVMAAQNSFDEAERWYGKVLAAYRIDRDRVGEYRTLHNLANLLRSRPGRLVDARRHAEQALAIQRTLDPAAVEIWKTYDILAEIAAAEGRVDEARAFRHQERQSFAAAPASGETLRNNASLMTAIANTAVFAAQRPALETALDSMIGRGCDQLVAALRRLLDGERDEDALTDGLDREAWLIVSTVLRARELLAFHAPIIRVLAAASLQPEIAAAIGDETLTGMRQRGWDNLADAAGRLLDGSRDADALCAGLDAQGYMIIRAALTAIEHPELLPWSAS